VPFGRQDPDWKDAHAALLLISNESFCVDTQTLLVDAGHMAGGSRGARLRFSSGSRLAVAICSAQILR